MGANALAPAPAPAPVAGDIAPGDWRDRLHAALMELGMKFTADAVAQSEVVQTGGDIRFTTPAHLAIYMQESEINKAVRRLTGRAMRIIVATGEVEAPPAPPPKAGKSQEDETRHRALDNAEVQRFRELFGGEIRQVRNLKE